MTGFQVFGVLFFFTSSMLLISFTDLLSLLFICFKSLSLISVSMVFLNKVVVSWFWMALFIFVWIIYLTYWWGDAVHHYLEALGDDRHGRQEIWSQAVADKILYLILIFLWSLHISDNDVALFGQWSESIDLSQSLYGQVWPFCMSIGMEYDMEAGKEDELVLVVFRDCNIITIVLLGYLEISNNVYKGFYNFFNIWGSVDLSLELLNVSEVTISWLLLIDQLWVLMSRLGRWGADFSFPVVTVFVNCWYWCYVQMREGTYMELVSLNQFYPTEDRIWFVWMRRWLIWALRRLVNRFWLRMACGVGHCILVNLVLDVTYMTNDAGCYIGMYAILIVSVKVVYLGQRGLQFRKDFVYVVKQGIYKGIKRVYLLIGESDEGRIGTRKGFIVISIRCKWLLAKSGLFKPGMSALRSKSIFVNEST